MFTQVAIQSLEKDLDEAWRRLLDTGMRSRLIHINRTNRRMNCLNIINEQSDEISKILRKPDRKMRFRVMDKDRSIDGKEMLLAVPDRNLRGEGQGHCRSREWRDVRGGHDSSDSPTP